MEKRLIYVYLITAISNIVGMILRYILEYGEYSNEVNFNTVNVFVFIVVLPLFCVVVYYLIKKIWFHRLK